MPIEFAKLDLRDALDLTNLGRTGFTARPWVDGAP
jgi:hypothetical protein